MMKHCDLILAGGGAAGLSLACHLLHSPQRDRSILIIEQGYEGTKRPYLVLLDRSPDAL